MMALFIAAAAVAVERYINRRRMKLHEVLADVGWLTLIFALIEFAYLFFVETLTLSYGTAARPLWYTEWGAFKDLLLNAAIAVVMILTSVWLESAGVRVELRRPRPLRRAATVARAVKPPAETQQQQKCDIEWREAS